MNILLGLTGSVASTLAPKLVNELAKLGEVRVIATESAKHFYKDETNVLQKAGASFVYGDRDEWTWQDPMVDDKGFKFSLERKIWQKGDPVVHIDLGYWADIFVIAPLTANTMAKMAHGLADNLLTSTFLAWDRAKPVIIAPAMNTRMWEAEVTQNNLNKLLVPSRYVPNYYVPPVSKNLACGDSGIGAMGDIQSIIDKIKYATRWDFPLRSTEYGKEPCPGIPIFPHPGSFGAKRKFNRHCGVDLYCSEDAAVLTMEDGRIVAIEPFTGPKAGYDWWLNTEAIKIEGASGVICYGEIRSFASTFGYQVGTFLPKDTFIGRVTPVLKEGKERPDIPGHSRSMLHVQLYKRGMLHKDEDWSNDQENPPEGIMDPTQKLLDSAYSPNYILTDIERRIRT